MSERDDKEQYKDKLDKARFGEMVSTAFPEVKKTLAEDNLRNYLVREAAQMKQDKLTSGSYNMSPFAGTTIQPRPPPAELINAQEWAKSHMSKLERLRQYELKRCKTRIEHYDVNDRTKVRRILMPPETGDQRKATVRVKILAKLKNDWQDQVLTPLNNEIGCFTGNIITHIINPRTLGIEEGSPMHIGIPDEDVDVKEEEE